MAVTVFFRRFPLLSALPSEGGAEGIMNVQFEMLPNPLPPFYKALASQKFYP